MEEKDYTLVFPRRQNEVLLGMKKRGFGVGKWNGFGGKIEKGETIEEAAVRELEEESGLKTTRLTRVGYLVFRMEASNKLMKVHVYDCWDDTFQAEDVTESDEMRPKWFKTHEIPYDDMWPDDPYWIPMYLKGQSFLGRFEYSDDETITDHSLTEQGPIKKKDTQISPPAEATLTT